jgi:predicted glycogen debranching enzyme
VQRGSGSTIIAGYPWFGDWGRDTFIALRGLCLATGRIEDARSVLVEWAQHVCDGMLPNRFPDAGGAPEYNSVDAALWFVIGVYELRAALARTKQALSRAKRSSTATSPARGTASGWTRTDSCAPARPACSSPGWTPRSRIA